ncbi:MAG: SPOR domain-containing protein [Spirochaetaceae bacterium]|jgi:DedD protein|nr:SPOR domain-containing protein [Spirochaetaceae bacterium]
MEKRKLLLISISIGIFLVIIIGASILMFSPKEPVSPVVTDLSRPIPPGNSELVRNEQVQPPFKPDLKDMVKNPDEIKGLQVPPASTIQENNNHIYINGEPINIQGEFISREETADGTRSRTNLVINVPSPKTPVVPAAVATPATKPASPVKPAAAAPSRTANPPAAKAVARAVPQAQPPKGRTNFWVQAGSFSTQTRAEGVKEILAAKGISSIIENRNVDGKTFYRVRVGPYASNTEADYWLTLIKQINGFEDSQIWQNQSKL